MTESTEKIRIIEQTKLIVIVRGLERKALLPFAEAVYAGGIRALEITYDASGKTPDAEIADRIGMLKTHFGERMLIGAGTVLTEGQVQLTADAGGDLIISPHTDAAVIAATKGKGMLSIPGAFTPTEMVHAHQSGADFVKLFPVTALSPSYIKAIRAPLPQIRLLAVGGVSLENVKAYLTAGVSGFGLGANIVDQNAILRGDYLAITACAKAYCDLVGGTV